MGCGMDLLVEIQDLLPKDVLYDGRPMRKANLRSQSHEIVDMDCYSTVIFINPCLEISYREQVEIQLTTYLLTLNGNGFNSLSPLY